MATEQPNWIEGIAGRPVEALKPLDSVEDVIAAREYFARVFDRALATLPEGVTLEHVVLRERDGRQLRAEVCAPATAGAYPTILYLHDGGWCAGKIENERDLCAEVAARGFAVVSLDYPVAPEHPFPRAVEDAVYGLRWVTRNAAQHGGASGSSWQAARRARTSAPPRH